MNLNEIYTELIADHNQSKRNKKELEIADIHQKGHNPSCGDEITLHVKYNGDVIEDMTFTGDGCAISQASTSIMIDLVKGKTKQEALDKIALFLAMIKKEEQDEVLLEENLEEAYVFQNISNMPSRVKCAVLAWHTLKGVIGT